MSGCNLPAGTEAAPVPPVGGDTNPPVNTAASLTVEAAPVITSTLTLMAEPASTSTTTSSPTPSVPTALFLMNANCRAKPDKDSEALMSFLEDETSEILGRSEDMDNTWWYVKMPDSKYKCWVSTITVQVIGNYDDIPTIHPPY